MLIFKPQITAVVPPPVTVFTGRRFKRIYGPALLSASTVTLYTVPTDVRTVIRHIHVSNPSASPVDFTLSIGADAAGTRLWNGQPVRADNLIQEFRDHTLVAGEVIQAFAGTTSVLNLTIDGYEESLASVISGGVGYGSGPYGDGPYEGASMGNPSYGDSTFGDGTYGT